ncbi:hypothetical protein HZS_3429, partial [Henneguya salminicola]
MKLDVDGLTVIFPYDYIYPEQFQYMLYLKQTLDAGGNSVIEMPSGTGKTISLISLIISYFLHYPSKYTKLIYCTRTVSEIEKVLEEIESLYNFYEKVNKNSLDFLSLGLSARKNLCINNQVCVGDARDVDRKCHALTSQTTRLKSQFEDVQLCEYFENFENQGRVCSFPCGVYTLEKLKSYGRLKNMCPYFMARQSVLTSKILVYSYAYLVDPKVAEIVSKEIESSSIVVFDEAHNIDSACIEAFSITLDQKIIISCRSAIKTVIETINHHKSQNSEKIKQEYSLLLEGLSKLKASQNKDSFLPNPIISQEILEESIPGNIRKIDHFISFFQRFVEYLASRMNTKHLIIETPLAFLRNINCQVGIDKRALRFCTERLRSLLSVTELDNNHQISSPLGLVASLGTIISNFDKGFCVIMEPCDPSTPNIYRPRLYLNCMDASLAIKPVFDRFKCVIITSGTLSPLDMYPRLLNFRPCIVASLSMTLARKSVYPIIVTRGSDQGILSSSYSDRFEPSVIRNYGILVVDICSCVPDGVVCFFTSYRHMEAAISSWSEMDLISKIQEKKLVFVETPNVAETNLALDGYKRACECGRGGLLFSIARGKVSEGIDFYDHLGRAVIVIGVPYVYTLSSVLLKKSYSIREADFLTFDAMRHTAQCIGRVMRSKMDYGIMILADQRFSKPSRIKKLPKWIQDNLSPANIGLGSDDAVELAKKFLKDMAQELPLESQIGVSMLNEEQLKSEKFLKRLETLQQAALET